MIDLQSDCDTKKLSEDCLLSNFDCGNAAINKFFNEEAILYQQQMLGQAFFLQHRETTEVVCAFSLCNDSIKSCLLPNSRRKRVRELIPHAKSMQSYPAFLIGQLGVAVQWQGQGVGKQLLHIISRFCINQYPNIARFLVVDAYNSAAVLNFYEQNDFSFVFSTEEQESDNLKKQFNTTEPLRTRQMFYDLMRWQ